MNVDADLTWRLLDIDVVGRVAAREIKREGTLVFVHRPHFPLRPATPQFDHSAGHGYLSHQVAAMIAVALIVGGLWLLGRARVAGDGRYARAVLMLFATGWVLILIGGLSHLASGDGTGPLATLGMVLPVVGGSLNTLTGLLLGVAIARAGRLPGDATRRSGHGRVR